MRRLLGGALTIMMCACQSYPVQYYIDSDLNADMVHKGAAWWNETCGTELLREGGGVHVLRGSCEDKGHDAEAWGDRVVVCGREGVELYAHEFGHILGLGHSDAGVMVSKKPELSNEKANRNVCAALGLPLP